MIINDIKIEGPWTPAHGPSAPRFSFNGVEFLQQSQWRQVGFDARDGIYKRRLIGISEGCRKHQSGSHHKFQTVFVQSLQRMLHVLLGRAPGT